jgi:hypothetical protein
MARARKSHDTGKEEVKTSHTKLEPPYSGKVGGNKYVVYADLQREGDPYARVLVLNFSATYAARYFIDLLIHNDTWEWVDSIGPRKCIRTSTGVRVSMFHDDLAMLLNCKRSEDERSWEDDLVKQNTLRFKYGTHEGAKATDNDNEEPEHGTDETLSDGGVKRIKSKGKGPRVTKEPKVKIDKSGFVTAIDIAGDSKLEGREIRGILRASDLKKPDVGWMWPKGSAELKAAEKVIKDGIKALLKKKGKK